MMSRPTTLEEAISVIEELQSRLEEAEEGIRAIRSGEVDAIVVTGPTGEQVYTLSGAEHTYRVLVEAMNEGALVLSPEGLIVYSNRTFAAMLGQSVHDVLGHAIYEFVAEADVEPLKRMLERAPMRSGRREIHFKHSDANPVPAFISIATLEDEEGPSIAAVVTDLTEHKRTEAELQQYREHLEELVVERTRELARARAEAVEWAARLESFIANMADGVTLFDADGKVVLMNDAGKAIYGVPPGEPFGDWSKYKRYTLDGKEIPVDETASFRALRGEMIRDMRFKIISPWGKESIVSVSASPARDSEGRIIGATNIFRDISDMVEFERQRQELYERERRISKMLQQALIPPEVPSVLQQLSIGVRYQPALREAEVGGDFYDVFELSDNKVGVLIGDVAGKGLKAAIRVAAARYSIRSYAYLDPSPSRVMMLTNDALCKEGSNAENMLTAFLAIIDTATGVMTYTSAGHEPPVVCNTREIVEELCATGVMLGVIPGAEYTECTRNLREGDSVVMFTDGITEARHNSIMFDKTGVIEHLKKACDATPDEIAGTLMEAAIQYAGGSLQDDAAILVVGFDRSS